MNECSTDVSISKEVKIFVFDKIFNYLRETRKNNQFNYSFHWKNPKIISFIVML